MAEKENVDSGKLTPEQRDLFIHSPALPRNLGHALHRAAVRQGKLTLRLTREELDALIIVAAKTRVPDRREERALTTLMRYLDGLENWFAEPENERGDE